MNETKMDDKNHNDSPIDMENRPCEKCFFHVSNGNSCSGGKERRYLYPNECWRPCGPIEKYSGAYHGFDETSIQNIRQSVYFKGNRLKYAIIRELRRLRKEEGLIESLYHGIDRDHIDEIFNIYDEHGKSIKEAICIVINRIKANEYFKEGKNTGEVMDLDGQEEDNKIKARKDEVFQKVVNKMKENNTNEKISKDSAEILEKITKHENNVQNLEYLVETLANKNKIGILHCPECGKKLLDNVKMCPFCGKTWKRDRNWYEKMPPKVILLGICSAISISIPISIFTFFIDSWWLPVFFLSIMIFSLFFTAIFLDATGGYLYDQKSQTLKGHDKRLMKLQKKQNRLHRKKLELESNLESKIKELDRKFNEN